VKKHLFLLGLLTYSLSASSISEKDSNCLKGNAEECVTLGLDYLKGRGVTKDKDKSMSYFQKACDLKDGLGCNNLGMSYRWLGDKENTLKYMDKSCMELDYKKACSLLGKLYFFGVSKEKFKIKIEKNEEKYLKYVGKSCDLGETSDCYKVQKIHPEKFDMFTEEEKTVVESTIIQQGKFIPKNSKLSMSKIIDDNNQMIKEGHFFKVKSKLSLFGSQVYYLGMDGVDMIPGPNAVIDGNTSKVSQYISKKYNIEFKYNKRDDLYFSKQDNYITIIVRPHHWENTSYVIGAYLGP